MRNKTSPTWDKAYEQVKEKEADPHLAGKNWSILNPTQDKTPILDNYVIEESNCLKNKSRTDNPKAKAHPIWLAKTDQTLPRLRTIYQTLNIVNDTAGQEYQK